ncbi:MAG: DUF4271 domain-containing protein, partial [Chitinophagaceae bacterium]
MLKLKIILCALLFGNTMLSFAQRNMTSPDRWQDSIRPTYRVFRDSAYRAEKARIRDSVYKHMLVNIRMKSEGDPLLDSILDANRRPGLTALNIGQYFKRQAQGNVLRQGQYLPKGELWSLGFIAGLLVLFSALRISVSRQLMTIVQAFFSNRILGNLNKEESLFTSWPFLMLFIVFGFVIGMFYFLVSQFYQLAGGFPYFVSISTGIIVLYFGKILLLKALGTFLEIKRPVQEYVTILFLSYFNAGLLFLPLVVAFVLSPLKFGVYYITGSYIILALIVIIQFVRAGLNILSANRFPKLYLLLY